MIFQIMDKKSIRLMQIFILNLSQGDRLVTTTALTICIIG